MNIEYAKQLAALFLKKAEGYRSTSYRDSAGNPTDGYGNTRIKPLGSKDLTQASRELNLNIDFFTQDIVKQIGLPQGILNHEMAALICFAFNCGVGNKTIWKLVKQRKFDLIPNEMLKWDHIHKNGKLQVNQGLINRRKAEIALWNTADIPTAAIPAPKGEVKKAPDIQKINNANKAAIVTTASAPIAAAATVTLTHPHYLLPVIVGLVVCLVLLLFYFLYRILMAVTPQGKLEMSEAFKTAFANYQAAIAADKAKAVKVVQDELDTANQQIDTLTNQLATQDAEDTQIVTDAANAVENAGGGQ